MNDQKINIKKLNANKNTKIIHKPFEPWCSVFPDYNPGLMMGTFSMYLEMWMNINNIIFLIVDT